MKLTVVFLAISVLATSTTAAPIEKPITDSCPTGRSMKLTVVFLAISVLATSTTAAPIEKSITDSCPTGRSMELTVVFLTISVLATSTTAAPIEEPITDSCPKGYVLITCLNAPKSRLNHPITWNDSLPFTADRFRDENITTFNASVCIPPVERFNGSTITCNYEDVQSQPRMEHYTIHIPPVLPTRGKDTTPSISPIPSSNAAASLSLTGVVTVVPVLLLIGLI